MLDYKEAIRYCLKKKASFESYPFGTGVPVIKVVNKIFALFSEDMDPVRKNLKCDPEDAQALRKEYEAVTPGYHMNKQHWNSVYLDGSVPDAVIREMIDHSYVLVVKSLKKTDRDKNYL